MRRFLVLVALLGCSLSGNAQRPPEHLRVSLLSEVNGVKPGGTQTIGIRFQLDPGWHIYWTNPGDSGEPPKISWHLPPGVTIGQLKFPTPRRIEAHSLTDYGYQGDAILLTELTGHSSFEGKSAVLTADVRWLVCREVCIPGRGSASIKLQAGHSEPSADANLIHEAEQKLPGPAPATWKLSATQQSSSVLLKIGAGHVLAVSDFIPAEPLQIDNARHPTVRQLRSGAELVLKKSDQLTGPLRQLNGLLITGQNAYSVTIPVSQSSKR
jgi:thiol:disulfide interchange protein DsbD